ncbi:MAG TPA: CPBP family glutamic-type intramembrane protease [Acidimicrobiales bacterium]
MTGLPLVHGTAPPGWYPDPWRQSWYRWWDGSRWTHALHPPIVVAAPAPKPPHKSATFARLGSIGILAGTFAAIVFTRYVSDALDIEPDWLLVVVVYTLLFGLMTMCAWAASVLLGSGSMRRDFGIGIKVDDIGWGALAFAGAMVARAILLFALSSQMDDPVREVGDSIDFEGATLVAFSFAAIVGAPIVEELVFRGVLQRSLTKLVGAPVAIGAQALLFAAYHFVPDGSGYSEFYFGALVAFGVAAGIAVDRTGRLGPGTVAHAINNAMAIVFLAAS